jgi:hypothetical protein
MVAFGTPEIPFAIDHHEALEVPALLVGALEPVP